ncbi:MAG: 6-bladed beta-propeller [Candidatus Omnitrophica bacterium]|nr:6-bladed beta-propeller [Candidatus Omnitrophota bacterium]
MKKNILLFSLFFLLSIGFADETLRKSEFKGEVFNPIKIRCYNKKVFILDKAEMSIKVIDNEGKIILRLGQKGQGPGEFTNVTDFCINDQKVYVLDAEGFKIEIFSEIDGKYIISKKINLSNPYNIAVNNKKIYISTITFLEGQKLLHAFIEENGLKPIASFLDCIPMEGLNFDSIYKNFGILTVSHENIFFAFYLSNKVVKFSENGMLVREYFLPIKSIEKPEIEQKGLNVLLKRALNYDMISKDKFIYLLSRDKKGDSIIFQLENGNFIKKFNIREKLVSFDILEDKLWGIDEEGRVLIYEVKE